MKKIAMTGLLVVIMPFLGFPIAWENIIYIILGSLVFLQAIYFSMKTDSEITTSAKKERQTEVYIENDDKEIE